MSQKYPSMILFFDCDTVHISLIILGFFPILDTIVMMDVALFCIQMR